MEDFQMLTLNDVIAITKPHNDKIVAEAEVERLRRQNKRLLEAIKEMRLKALNAKAKAETAEKAAGHARLYAADCEAIAEACIEALSSAEPTK
jgi:hypothetical protein